MAIAGAVLKGNAPLPAGRVRRRSRIRRELPRGRGYGPGAVAGQPVCPVPVTRGQRALDQQAAKPRAIDKQIAVNLALARQFHAVHKAAGRILLDLDDFPFDTRDPALLGIVAQERGVQAGVKMVGVVECREHMARIGRGPREAALRAQRPGHAVIVQGAGLVLPMGLQPVLVHGYEVELPAVDAERVEVAMLEAGPVHELDADLKRAPGAPHEGIFVDAQGLIEGFDRRYRGFANAHGPDLLRFNECDRTLAPKGMAQGRRGHPAGGAAADDDEALNPRIAVVHVRPVPRRAIGAL